MRDAANLDGQQNILTGFVELDIEDFEDYLRSRPGWYKAVVKYAEIVDLTKLGNTAYRSKLNQEPEPVGYMTHNIAEYSDEIEDIIAKDEVIKELGAKQRDTDELVLAWRLRRSLVVGMHIIKTCGLEEPTETSNISREGNRAGEFKVAFGAKDSTV